jgi:ribosome assembly protein YihI (activator of Der GTPase)
MLVRSRARKARVVKMTRQARRKDPRLPSQASITMHLTDFLPRYSEGKPRLDAVEMLPSDADGNQETCRTEGIRVAPG